MEFEKIWGSLQFEEVFKSLKRIKAKGIDDLSSNIITDYAIARINKKCSIPCIQGINSTSNIFW